MLARAVVLAAVLAVRSEPHGRILGKHQGENESDFMPCSRSRTIYGEHTVPDAITPYVIAGAPGHPRWRAEEVRQRLKEKLRAQALERREERFKADDLAAARAARAPVSDSTTTNVAAAAKPAVATAASVAVTAATAAAAAAAVARVLAARSEPPR